MTVALYSEKGGVGKTSLSYSLHKDLGLRYVTNDMCESALKSNNSKFYTKTIPFSDNVLYDFGGFESKEAYKICSMVDLVIVPTICEMNSLFKALMTIKKIKAKKVLVIVTMIDKEEEFNQVKMVINKHFPGVDLLPFRRNKLLKKVMEEKMSVFEFIKKSTKRHLYKNITQEYMNIIQYIKSV